MVYTPVLADLLKSDMHNTKQFSSYGLLPDYEIRRLAEAGMIHGFEERTAAPLSYGLSSFGYDLRVTNQFTYLRPDLGPDFVLNPVKPDKSAFITVEADLFILPAHTYALCVSYEQFHIPDNILVICVGKSTYARAGVVVNVTPLEPGWKGYLTIEISNTSSAGVQIRANEGIGQLLFLRSTRPEITYADRNGKYQNQGDSPEVGRG